MQIRALDHLVLTVTDLDVTLSFYERVLGMRRVQFGERFALGFGDQKLNLHEAGAEFEPKAALPTPGSADLCFLVDGSVDAAADELRVLGVVIEEGPVARTGARGPLRSIYFRDPDGNLIEVAEPTT